MNAYVLPDSILLEVFKYLSKRELLTSSMVSTTWRRICYDKSLWRDISICDLEIPGEILKDDNLRTLLSYSSTVNSVFLQNCLHLTNKSLYSLSLSSSKLQCLDLENCHKISDRGVMVLAKHCSSLRAVNLFGTRVTEVGLKCLFSQNKGLKELTTCAKALTENAIWELTHYCKDIELLQAETCDSRCSSKPCQAVKLTDTMVMMLAANCQHLIMLTLNYVEAKISDWVLAYLGYYCPKLECVEIGQLDEKSLLNDVGVMNFCLPLRNLRNLTLKETAVSDVTLHAIASSCTDLEALNLQHCQRFSDIGILSLVKNCTQLQSLNVGSGWDGRLTNISAFAIAQSACAKNLLSLSMYLWKIDDFGLYVLSCNLTNLQNLSLEGCLCITYDGLKKSLAVLKNLKTLDLSFTECITCDEDLLSLFVFWESLDALKMYGCPDVTAYGLNELKSFLPNCYIESEKIILM